MDSGRRDMRSRTLMVGAAMALVLVLAGCGATHQARSTKTSGFLGDYSQLREGEGDEALLLYVSPDADFSRYNKILFEPVAVYTEPKSTLAQLPVEQVQALLSYLDAAVREALKDDYEFVTEHGAGVMKLRIAVTEAKGSKVVLDTVSSVIPIGIAVSAIKRVAVGTHLAVGSARIEGELLDSVTGERLFAAVDERAGRKYTGKFDKWSKWEDARDAYDYWAERLGSRLADLRAG